MPETRLQRAHVGWDVADIGLLRILRGVTIEPAHLGACRVGNWNTRPQGTLVLLHQLLVAEGSIKKTDGSEVGLF